MSVTAAQGLRRLGRARADQAREARPGAAPLARAARPAPRCGRRTASRPPRSSSRSGTSPRPSRRRSSSTPASRTPPPARRASSTPSPPPSTRPGCSASRRSRSSSSRPASSARRCRCDRIIAGLDAAAPALSADGGDDAAEAILTTDTKSKVAAVETGGFIVGGMAKGSGMIHPEPRHDARRRHDRLPARAGRGDRVPAARRRGELQRDLGRRRVLDERRGRADRERRVAAQPRDDERVPGGAHRGLPRPRAARSSPTARARRWSPRSASPAPSTRPRRRRSPSASPPRRS